MSSKNTLTQTLSILGRLLIASFFIPYGLSKFSATGFQSTVGYITAQGLPFPTLGVIASIIVEVGIAGALLFNFKTFWASLFLGVYCIVSAALFHQFWAASAETEPMMQMYFFKNMAIAGGLFLFAANHYNAARNHK